MSDLIGASTAVSFADSGQAAEWFHLIADLWTEQSGGGNPVGWGGFKEALVAASGDRMGNYDFANTFVEWAEKSDGDPVDHVRVLAEDPDAALAWYRDAEERALAHEDAGSEASAQGTDWDGFITEAAAAWNSSSGTWDDFRAWFLGFAESRGLSESATALVDYVAASADAAQALAAYGIELAPAGEALASAGLESEVPESESHDEVVSELIAENPELAGLTAEEIEAVMQELLAELAEPNS